MKNKLQSVIYAILRALIIFCLIAIVGGIFVAFYSFMDDPPNNTIGVIGGVICFGGFGLSWLIVKVGGKIVDHFESLHEPDPEPEPDTLPEEDELPLSDDNSEDQTVSSEDKEMFTKIGFIASAVVAIVMIGGILFAQFGNRADDDNHSLVVIGILIAVAPVLVLLAMALLPEKIRGVKKKPRRLRAMEILVIVSMLMAFGGFFSVFGILVFARGAKVLYIFASSCVVLGFVGLFIFTKKYRDLAGKYTIRIEVFPSDEEFEKSAYNALNKMGVVDTVLDDEQERELRRIEEQDRQAGIVHMTKEQVEEYEKRKRF